MRKKDAMSNRRHAFLVALIASLVLGPSLSARAQGIGPPPGTEVILWIFLAGAAMVVLVVSTVLFVVSKKVLFKDRVLSRLQKVVLFVASILTSCAAGVFLMILFDIR